MVTHADPQTGDAGFEPLTLDERHVVFTGLLPQRLTPEPGAFEALWNLHPEAYPEILMHGRLVKTPRWQQSYGRDYRYSGQTNAALPVPDSLEPFREWAQSAIDSRLNGLLLNWYDGAL